MRRITCISATCPAETMALLLDRRRRRAVVRCFVWSSGQSVRVSSSVGECGPGQYHYLRLRIIRIPLNRKLSSNLGSSHSSVGETSRISIPISRFNVCLFVCLWISRPVLDSWKPSKTHPKNTKRCLLQNGSPVPGGVHLPMSSSEMMSSSACFFLWTISSAMATWW